MPSSGAQRGAFLLVAHDVEALCPTKRLPLLLYLGDPPGQGVASCSASPEGAHQGPRLFREARHKLDKGWVQQGPRRGFYVPAGQVQRPPTVAEQPAAAEGT